MSVWLFSQGIFFKDSNTLAYYNVANGSTVQLQLKERGGRKKWADVYGTACRVPTVDWRPSDSVQRVRGLQRCVQDHLLPLSRHLRPFAITSPGLGLRVNTPADCELREGLTRPCVQCISPREVLIRG